MGTGINLSLKSIVFLDPNPYQRLAHGFGFETKNTDCGSGSVSNNKGPGLYTVMFNKLDTVSVLALLYCIYVIGTVDNHRSRIGILRQLLLRDKQQCIVLSSGM